MNSNNYSSSDESKTSYCDTSTNNMIFHNKNLYESENCLKNVFLFIQIYEIFKRFKSIFKRHKYSKHCKKSNDEPTNNKQKISSKSRSINELEHGKYLKTKQNFKNTNDINYTTSLIISNNY